MSKRRHDERPKMPIHEVVASPDSPAEKGPIDPFPGKPATPEPGTLFVHPLLPDYVFPSEVVALDILDLRKPGKFEKAVLDAIEGKPTAVYDEDGRPLGGGQPKSRIVIAVVVHPDGYAVKV